MTPDPPGRTADPGEDLLARVRPRLEQAPDGRWRLVPVAGGRQVVDTRTGATRRVARLDTTTPASAFTGEDDTRVLIHDTSAAVPRRHLRLDCAGTIETALVGARERVEW